MNIRAYKAIKSPKGERMIIGYVETFSVDQVEHRWARVELFGQNKRSSNRVWACSSKVKSTIDDKSKSMTETNGKDSATVSKKEHSKHKKAKKSKDVVKLLMDILQHLVN
ncbi:hypothetical protein RclHR1_00340025 [Rhizophagus clarus]|uniref:Uncharacterized protein n=1 Tax=Rhizophagus clarus TaxID=94130 RepID=A0A2Z6RLH2_9GLOM|nr:hypothetical protein RclHR1_00340025 [Rhizophagus clarus]GES92851.1 hypothetical protein RCL_jg28142.t1 [Rhizophagus clarus]